MKTMDTELVKKMDTFFSQFPERCFKKEQVLIQEGEEPSGIFYIMEGIVRRYWISANGDEITLNLYKPHSFLPMSWAIANVPNTHFYAALTDVRTRQAPKQAVLSFVKSEPDILYDLLRRVYVGMEGLWTHVEHLTTGNSYTKLVTSLVILAKRFGKEEESGIHVNLKLSEKDLAEYAGIARETTNRELQKLKQGGLVTFEKGTIVVHNLRKLQHQLL